MYFFFPKQKKKYEKEMLFYVAVNFIHAFRLSCNKTGLPAGSMTKAITCRCRKNCSFGELRSYSRSALKGVTEALF